MKDPTIAILPERSSEYIVKSFRGGSQESNAADRNYLVPSIKGMRLGFRLIRNVDPKERI